MATKALGAKFCVIHNPSTLMLGPNADPQLMRDLSFDMLTNMVNNAKKYDIKNISKYKKEELIAAIEECMEQQKEAEVPKEDNGKIQKIAGLNIYPPEYLCPKNERTGLSEKTKNTRC